MWFIQGDITINSKLSLSEVTQIVTKSLGIPPMTIDTSGRYEDVDVYTVTFFGLELSIARTIDDPPDTYHLWISSDVDNFKYDGSEREVDATQYTLALLKKSGIDCSPRDPELLFG